MRTATFSFGPGQCLALTCVVQEPAQGSGVNADFGIRHSQVETLAFSEPCGREPVA